MTFRAAVAAILLALVAALASPASADPTFPPLTGRVTDAANIIPADVKAQLTEKLAALEKQTGYQVVVATIPDLQGYEISDYGYQLGRAWGIGQKDKNTGAILIVAPNERKVRIEVGYGLEPVLTDGFSSDVIRNDILPRFKAGDMPGGIEAGVDAIVKQLGLTPEQVQQQEAARQQAMQSNQGGSGIGGFIFFMFVLFFFILPVLRGLFGRRRLRRYGRFGTALWVLSSILNSGGGRGSGGGGFGGGFGGGGSFGGGGGFSGGGGSFGGGGASGSW